MNANAGDDTLGTTRRDLYRNKDERTVVVNPRTSDSLKYLGFSFFFLKKKKNSETTLPDRTASVCYVAARPIPLHGEGNERMVHGHSKRVGFQNGRYRVTKQI